MNSKTITKGFVIAGLMNMSVMVFSRFFSNPVIPEFDPVVMSNFGLLMIVIWGLAYISVAKYYQHTKWLIGVFAVEKLIYGFNWTTWILNNDLSNIYDKDLFAGLFFSVYGINDWLFFLFFSYVFIQIFSLKK
ncbi:hypothetical protein [Christiangramia echinicola]|uniref:Uncharacterized protein n=1 Tax=Christiangramia echinicola TaxID=279359 RepID=A0A1H1PL89_9FLAO|nr:hypothetical protein [Christiangramia echinicola]SDS11860.1 hypothetical protein SAMN04488552_2156 [Christiangramia echinicola]